MTDYKSEIRDSTINALLEKAASRNYGKYLPKLVLKQVRGFVDEPVFFDFPVTAIIGPNGGGKTTILGAAGCAYKEVPPKRFFSKSGTFDESMQDWAIEYELVDRDLSAKDVVRRTASFKNHKWNRKALGRETLIFGVARTVPVNERSELRKCASTKFTVPESDVSSLSEPVCTAVSRILGKDVSGFRELNVQPSGKVTLLAGNTLEGVGYSEFHFGAGESSIIRMIIQIEAAQENALVLIEEIENGLHPVATIRMVEFLIEAAERKRIQCIFTTHSNDALRVLPSRAIWVATQQRIFQGKLDVHSLRAITGQTEAQLAIFVEDEFAKTWVEAILRNTENVALSHLEIHAMAGDGTAVAINKNHNLDPAATTPSVCVIDGDSAQQESEKEKVYRLPGESPEAYVYDKVLEVADAWGGKIAVALLQTFEEAERVVNECRQVRLTNQDPHLLFSQAGGKLGLIPETTVKNAFATIWAQAYKEEAAALTSQFAAFLPMEQE